MAAKWEFEENASASSARDLLLRVLRFHPESIVVYTEVGLLLIFLFRPRFYNLIFIGLSLGALGS